MANEMAWHKVSESEKEEIKKDAKKLLDDFSKKLKEIKTKEGHLENGNGIREETNPWENDEEFRELMFGNAPYIEGDLVKAEVGGWKK